MADHIPLAGHTYERKNNTADIYSNGSIGQHYTGMLSVTAGAVVNAKHPPPRAPLVLILVDLCYPEALPLKIIDAEVIAEEVVSLHV